MNIVVCDDDATLRTVVSRLAQATGHTVLAETDNATDAADMVIRFGAEALVLDLSLPWGSGLQAARELRRLGSGCQVIVFTAYAADSPEIRDLGVRAIVEKPDFEALEQVLVELATGAAAASPAGSERRKPVPPRPRMPGIASATVSSLEDPGSFADAVQHLEDGDAALVVMVVTGEAIPGWFGQVVALDQVLAVARCLRTVLRTQDRLTMIEPVPGERAAALASVLVAGSRPGVESVFRRLEKAHVASRLPGVISAGWALVEPMVSGGLALTRAEDAARRSLGRPEGDRLWAG